MRLYDINIIRMEHRNRRVTDTSDTNIAITTGSGSTSWCNDDDDDGIAEFSVVKYNVESDVRLLVGDVAIACVVVELLLVIVPVLILGSRSVTQ